MDVTNVYRSGPGLNAEQLGRLQALERSTRITGWQAGEARFLSMQGTPEQKLTQARLQAVAAAYDDVVKKARVEAAKVVKQTQPTIEKLIGSMSDVAELLAAVREVRTARNAESAEGHRQFHDGKLTADAFIRHAAAGSDPLELLDLTGASRTVERDHGMTVSDKRTRRRSLIPV
jgi:hypothetical protein